MSGYQAPTAELIAEALRRTPTPVLRRAFYGKLRNPLWVRPLMEAGAFTAPPEPQITDDGLIRDIYWPEVDYLARVAGEVPDDVVDVLVQLKDSNNAWVKRATAEIAAVIPAAQGVKLLPLLKAWATSSTGLGWRTDESSLVSFAVQLLDGGQVRPGRELANLLFMPRRPRSNEPFQRKPELTLDEHWYVTELPRIATALGGDALSATSGWLATYLKHAGYAGSDSDFSGIVRPSIRDRGDDLHQGPDDALVEVIRDLAVARLLDRDVDGVAAPLLRPKVQLHRKIAMYSVAEAIRSLVADSRDAAHLVPITRDLLSGDESDESNLRIEYAELAQAVAHVDRSALDVVNEFIASAYERDLEWMRARSVQPDAVGGAETDAEIVERADRYKHQMLSAIGAGALPPRLRDELAGLDGRFGRIDEPLPPNGMVTSWTGPNPYSTRDEMAAMSSTELVAHLASWHDSSGIGGPHPTHEGQGRELASLLTTSPLAVAGVHDLVSTLRPTYLRAVLNGWEGALKADIELDWFQVADVIGDILSHGNESSFPAEGDAMDDDANFRGVKRAAVGLLGELLKRREGAGIPEPVFDQLVDLLIDRADDTVAWEEYDSYEAGEGGWDALTVSLNWQWPQRIRGLIHLAVDTDDGTLRGRALDAVESELARVDRRGAGYAVLGENLGRLLRAAREWTRDRVATYFGTAASLSVQQQIALTTAMATHYYHDGVYELLSGPMIAAISLGDRLVSGWRGASDPVKRIGEWVIEGRIRDDFTSTDPVSQVFFSETDSTVRGDALGQVAWSFFRAERVDGPIRDRFADLWDERLAHVKAHPEDSAELKGSFWLAKGDKFPVGWWLPRLMEALEIDVSIATERYMIGRELAQASAVDPVAALRVLKLLLSGREQSGMVSYDLTRHAVPVVLAAAMQSQDPVVAGEAEAYMHELGSAGNLSLAADVEAVLRGDVTLKDVKE